MVVLVTNDRRSRFPGSRLAGTVKSGPHGPFDESHGINSTCVCAHNSSMSLKTCYRFIRTQNRNGVDTLARLRYCRMFPNGR
jgi:hypothetical protein